MRLSLISLGVCFDPGRYKALSEVRPGQQAVLVSGEEAQVASEWNKR
jgi:hypothetical protein